MDCNDVEKLIQERLDGNDFNLDSAESHLKNCAACRDLLKAVKVLERGLQAQSAPLVPMELVESVVTGVMHDRARSQQRRKRWLGAFVVAASLLLIFGLSELIPNAPKETTPQPEVVQKPGAEPTLGDKANEVKLAMIQKAQEQAEQTVHVTSQLISKIKMPVPSTEIDVDIDPGTGEGVLAGVKPVANSAVRAWNVLQRDFAGLGKKRSGL